MSDPAVAAALRSGESVVDQWACRDGTAVLTGDRVVFVPEAGRSDPPVGLPREAAADPTVRPGTSSLTYSLITAACLGWAAVAAAYGVVSGTVAVLLIAGATGVAGLGVGVLAYRRRDPGVEVTAGSGTDLLRLRFEDEATAKAFAAALRAADER